ncbi:hypothetical protein V6N12_056266 [Hibiscus sabdariffa]|uniref:HORMA domain-containing protein n=1 Tax=Hibiscus sabdariffa TaxID=183260 RepID=A0ABR2CS00_9ROSI
MLLTQDEGVKSFISNLTAQLSEWLEAGKLQRVVMVIMSKATNEVFERWNFSIETDSEVLRNSGNHETDCLEYYLLAVPRRSMRVRCFSVHRYGCCGIVHLDRE